MPPPTVQTHVRRRSANSIEEEAPELVPPRPFFLSPTQRGSYSSAESLDPASTASDSSDRETVGTPTTSNTRAPLSGVPPRQRHHARRRSNMYASVEVDTPPATANPEEPWSAHYLSESSSFIRARPPPSSFNYPFQSHPGNPDPLPSRRSSMESLRRSSELSHDGHRPPKSPRTSHTIPRINSASSSIYQGSAAANLSTGQLPRGSTSFRPAFQSPASRPSSIWSPPSLTHLDPTASVVALPPKPPAPSTRLVQPLTTEEKPWTAKTDSRDRMAYWLTWVCFLLGVGGAAVVVWRGYSDVFLLKDSDICLEFQDNFEGNSLNDAYWSREVELGGFGNNEFAMATDRSENVFVTNGNLYLMPTLTTDVLDEGTNKYELPGCTSNNQSACVIRGGTIPPIMSGRISTKGKKSIQYGKIEVRAKLPRGDWLWPAIWMLPEQPDDGSFGEDVDAGARGVGQWGKWPFSGEIDIMEARGNGVEYRGQGRNFVRSSVNYGPLPGLVKSFYGWFSVKQGTFADGFHTYTLEWDPKFIRIYVDSRLQRMLEIRTRNQKEGWWHRGDFPKTAINGSSEVVVNDIYGGDKNAPFNKKFYLIINLAAGGTSGWFQDKIGNKPWFDGSLSAMSDFAAAKDEWFKTWPMSREDRAFRIDSVKMYRRC